MYGKDVGKTSETFTCTSTREVDLNKDSDKQFVLAHSHIISGLLHFSVVLYEKIKI